MLVSNHTREPASATPPMAAGTSILMRYHAKVKPTERLSRMLAQIAQFESSWSASRAGVDKSCDVSPSLGAPGTSPSATRHSPLTCRRSSALFRSSATLGIGALLLLLGPDRIRVRRNAPDRRMPAGRDQPMTTPARAFHEKNVTLANGLTIHYFEWPGPKPNLVLLHPSSGYGRMWEATASALGSRCHVWALDQRGHGDSGRPDGDY